MDAGVDRSYVSRLERNLENPTVAVLDRLAGALGCDVVEFFTETERADVLPSGRRKNAQR